MQNPSCSPLLPNGVNGNCSVPLSEIEVPIFMDKDVVFDSLSDVLNRVNWKNLVQVDLTAFSPAGITSYEPTTDDPNIVTAESTGEKVVTNTPIPSALVYLNSNSCDYSEILSNLQGGVYGVVYALKGNKVILANEDGKFMPIPAKLNAITKGIPLKETFNNFPVWINHLDYESFATSKVIALPFNVASILKKAMPAGANMEISTTYNSTTGTVVLDLNNRCETDKITTAVAADFSILESNDLTSPAVISCTPVTGVDGRYEVVINKEVIPEALSVGDYVTLVYKEKSGTIVNRISNRLDIVALT